MCGDFTTKHVFERAGRRVCFEIKGCYGSSSCDCHDLYLGDHFCRFQTSSSRFHADRGAVSALCARICGALSGVPSRSFLRTHLPSAHNSPGTYFCRGGVYGRHGVFSDGKHGAYLFNGFERRDSCRGFASFLRDSLLPFLERREAK